MIKKINIFLVLLILLMSVGAVSAMDSGDIAGDGTVEDTLEVSQNDDIGYDTSEVLTASSHTITDDNYNQYFDSRNGNLVSSQVKAGDTINLDGSFSGKKFQFNQTVTIVGTSTNDMKNTMITLLGGASGSSISNLKIANTKGETYGIFLNTVNNCTVDNCVIKNSGKASYCIAVANGANYNSIINNDLTAYGVTYGHGTRSTPPLLLSGSHHNYIANNHVEADDANGIYLSSYDGGPLKGGLSNFNTIYNNTVHYNVLPTSWSYGLQIMGNNNTMKSNRVIGAYRGISTAGSGNVLIENTIINLTGADYNHLGVETGGEYALVGAYNSLIANNTVIGAKIISTGAAISAIDNSVIEHNWVEVTKSGKGIAAGGSNVIVRDNVVFTESGAGIYEKDEGSGLLVENNTVTSQTGVGILIEKLSSRRMPSNVTVIGNTVNTTNKYAIEASGVQEDSSNIDLTSNRIIGSGLINSPAGVFDSSKPTYIYKGSTHVITPSNIRDYIDANGGLTPDVKDGDILNFQGSFSNEVLYVTKGVKITGDSPVFYNSTFKVTSGNVLIENLTIINREANRVNAWGIFVNQAPGVRIVNNNINVNDPKASYAIYVLESTDVDVFNNVLTSEGEYLTFTLLAYASEDCNFANNTIYTIGTGEIYTFEPEKCIDGNELVIDGKTYCLDGNELTIDGQTYCLDGNELTIDGKTYCLDGNELTIDGKTYCIDGNELTIDGKTYCIDGNELTIDGRTYCIDGNELTIDGRTYCIDGNEFVIDGTKYCIDGNEVSIDGTTYWFDGNELTIDGKTYCLDGNELTIDGKTYCLDGNELTIDGTAYCIDGNELSIDGKTYCIDGNELVIDGTTYCLDGNEISIDGKTYCLDGNELTIDGKTYCLDGNELTIDGKTYCLDGNELTIDGVTYCVDGSEFDSGHVISEIYRTYGILLLYSSNNKISGNDVNVTSKLTKSYPTTGNGSSTNSIVGIDAYYNTHNNTFDGNNIYIKAYDNYIYGMGVLGYYTGHAAPEGQGATGNRFIGNIITLEGNYFATGMIVGDESEGTILDSNVISLNADGVTYGITLEMSQKSTILNNTLTLNSQAVYGAQLYASSGNVINGNVFNATANDAYAILVSNGNDNEINDNLINCKGNANPLTFRNLDSIPSGNAGVYLRANSTGNVISQNNITTLKNYAVLIDESARNNVVTDNYLDSEKGIGNAAVSIADNNNVSGNYRYVANPVIAPVHAEYLGTGEFNLTFDNNANGAAVRFYDIDGNCLGESVVSDAVASFRYEFGEDYIPAQYIFTAQFIKENYKESLFNIKFTISKATPNLKLENVTIKQGLSGNIAATVLNANGKPMSGVTVDFNRLNSIGRSTPIGTAKTGADGVAVLSYEVPSSLAEGEYDINAEINGLDYYNDAESVAKLTVLSGVTVTVTISPSAYTTGVVAVLKDSNGNLLANKNVTVKVSNVEYELSTNDNGEVKLPAAVKQGTYQVAITSKAEGSYPEESNNALVKVISPIRGGKNYAVYYGNTVKYKVRIFGLDGKAVGAGEVVKFKINGKSKNVKTNKNGYATYSAKLKAGKYTITAQYAGVKVSNKITFKPTLTAKNIVKKKSKTIKFTAKLVSKKGKALKNKKITFKIKSNKYFAKTNKKGVATVSIKNLKVGKFTITSSYGGCTIKNTIKIK